jgi:hypothetical protein
VFPEAPTTRFAHSREIRSWSLTVRGPRWGSCAPADFCLPPASLTFLPRGPRGAHDSQAGIFYQRLSIRHATNRLWRSKCSLWTSASGRFSGTTQINATELLCELRTRFGGDSTKPTTNVKVSTPHASRTFERNPRCASHKTTPVRVTPGIRVAWPSVASQSHIALWLCFPFVAPRPGRVSGATLGPGFMRMRSRVRCRVGRASAPRCSTLARSCNSVVGLAGSRWPAARPLRREGLYRRVIERSGVPEWITPPRSEGTRVTPVPRVWRSLQCLREDTVCRDHFRAGLRWAPRGALRHVWQRTASVDEDEATARVTRDFGRPGVRATRYGEGPDKYNASPTCDLAGGPAASHYDRCAVDWTQLSSRSEWRGPKTTVRCVNGSLLGACTCVVENEPGRKVPECDPGSHPIVGSSRPTRDRPLASERGHNPRSIVRDGAPACKSPSDTHSNLAESSEPVVRCPH